MEVAVECYLAHTNSLDMSAMVFKIAFLPTVGGVISADRVRMIRSVKGTEVIFFYYFFAEEVTER